MPAGSFSVADLGYFNLDRIVARREAHSYTPTRPQSSTAFFTVAGKRLQLQTVVPLRVGQIKEMSVLVGVKQHHPMRLLMMRVPNEIAQQRRQRLLSEAGLRSEQVSAQALSLCEWLLLLTDAPAKYLSLQEAIVLQRERWQIELLFKRMARNMGRLMNGARHTAGGFCASCTPNWLAFCSNTGLLFSSHGRMSSRVWLSLRKLIRDGSFGWLSLSSSCHPRNCSSHAGRLWHESAQKAPQLCSASP